MSNEPKELTKGEKAVVVTSMIGTLAFFLVWVLPVVLLMIFFAFAVLSGGAD